MVEVLSVDHLMDQLASMADESYGERVTMLDHSLQCAALAEASGASDEMVAAALLHDIGHVHDEAGVWGYPTHAEAGAAYLRATFGPGVVEPIRLHVDAKRYLVATDAAYSAELSYASTMSLAEQGGAFEADQVADFEQLRYAAAAIRLRRWDDAGKVDGLHVEPLASYRALLERLSPRSAGALLEQPAPWVRDMCTCSECRDSGSGQHLLAVDDLFGWSVGQVVEHDDLVEVTMMRGPDEHVCVVPTSSTGSSPPANPLTRLQLWGADGAASVLNSAVQRDNTNGFCRRLDSYGICLVQDVPSEPGSVLSFAETVGFVRSTNYGSMFDVVTVPDPNNLAYTSLGLPLHTDNPYREPCPTVQLLHCLQPSAQGGASQFSDGFAAAAELERVDPAAYAVLTSTPLTFAFRDAQVELSATRPMIELGAGGYVTAISVNHRSMQTPDPAAVDVAAFYRAYRRFASLVDEAKIELRLRAGQLVGFDNRRVLHARSAFDVTERRHLQGCYIDIDAVRSTARRAERSVAG